MSASITPLLQWINDHPNLSGLITFLISTAESVAIIGTIVPGSIMMTAIGTLAGADIIPLWSTILWAILGAIAGDTISYSLGFHYKEHLRDLWPFRNQPQLLQSGEKFFRKYGGMSVFIGRFVGPVRALVPLVAGMLGMKPLRFVIANITSAIGWAPTYMLPGILLGAASLELPPDIAIHIIFMILLIVLCVMLTLWFLQRIFILIGHKIDQTLTSLWNQLTHSHFLRVLTNVLKHYDKNRTHGQLTLAFYLILASILFCYLVSYLSWYGPENIFINNVLFHLLRSFRGPTSDNIMLFFSTLGEATVVGPVCITLFIYFAFSKRWHTAWHIFALGALDVVTVELSKHLLKESRPWGTFNPPSTFAFPSGHSVLAITIYLGVALLLAKAMNLQNRWRLYWPTLLFILAISTSRIYLGAHWFTDVLGGWLLGTIILILVALSYNRKAELLLRPLGIFLTIILTLSITYTAFDYRYHQTYRQNAALLDWPTYTVTASDWWQQRGEHLPLYRTNRLGLRGQLFNLQWLGDIAAIKKTLLQNGWEIAPDRNWISILQRISDVDSAEHIPIVIPRYLDRTPVLIMEKTIGNKKRLMVLRLWKTNLVIQNSPFSLWVGFIETVPRTYSWLFKHLQSRLLITPDIIFNKPVHLYEIKEMTIDHSAIKKHHHSINQTMILIKQRE